MGSSTCPHGSGEASGGFQQEKELHSGQKGLHTGAGRPEAKPGPTVQPHDGWPQRNTRASPGALGARPPMASTHPRLLGKANFRAPAAHPSPVPVPATGSCQSLSASPSPAAQDGPPCPPPRLSTRSLIGLPVAGLGLAHLIVPLMTHTFGRADTGPCSLQAQLSNAFPSHACLLALPGLCPQKGLGPTLWSSQAFLG